jgi:hypothetical protein
MLTNGYKVKKRYKMKTHWIYNVAIILVIAILLILPLNALGRETEAGDYRDGYGSYDMMGQNPDDIIEYGRDMMRYGFREMNMSGGYSKYPGYDRNMRDETVKKLNAEQEAFIKATEDLRQTIYEKELYLKAELVKKDPDTAIALDIQGSISEARAQFEQIMIGHLIRMKKINSEAETK